MPRCCCSSVRREKSYCDQQLHVRVPAAPPAAGAPSPPLSPPLPPPCCCSAAMPHSTRAVHSKLSPSPQSSSLPPGLHLHAAVASVSAADASAKCKEDEETADAPRCQRCAPDGSKCLQCWPGNGLSSSGACVPCNVTTEHGDRCIACDGDDPSFCTECRPRFGMGGATGEYWAAGQPNGNAELLLGWAKMWMQLLGWDHR